MEFLKLAGHWPWYLTKQLRWFFLVIRELVSKLMPCAYCVFASKVFWDHWSNWTIPLLWDFDGSPFLQLTFYAPRDNTWSFPSYPLSSLFHCSCYHFSHNTSSLCCLKMEYNSICPCLSHASIWNALLQYA